MATTLPANTRYVNSLIAQRGFAWAKYYESVRGTHVVEYRYLTRLNDMTQHGEEGFPPHVKNELMEMAKELKKNWECPVCIDTIVPDNLEITNCGHYFCKGCLVRLKEQVTTGDVLCPCCRRKICRK
jgi:hypothetical protein